MHIPRALMSLYGCNNNQCAWHLWRDLPVLAVCVSGSAGSPRMRFLFQVFASGMGSVIHPAAAASRRNPTLSWSSAKTGLHPDAGAGPADAVPRPAAHCPSLITPSAAQMRTFLARPTAFVDAQKWAFFKTIAGFWVTARHRAALMAAMMMCVDSYSCG